MIVRPATSIGRRVIVNVFAGLFSLIAVPMIAAQSSTGAMLGEIQDTSGARVAGAKITVSAIDSTLARATTATSNGEFRITDLQPGRYLVLVKAPTFADTQTTVEVVVSTMREFIITLKPAALQAQVSVQSESSSVTAEPIDTTSAVHQGTVTNRDLESLPLASRSFANIAYLVPGTEPVEPSDPTKARITAVSTGGSSGLNNVLSVDGADNSDDWIGGFLQNFSADAVQEFAVRTANENADSGWTTAGSVVITTKRGTNQWHGDAAFYERDASLNARFPIENPAPDSKQPFSRQNYVGTLGGSIARNKLWFFASFEHVHENASIAYNPQSTAQFQALRTIAADALIPGIPSLSVPNNVTIPFRDYLGSLRFDWAQSSKSNWFLRTSLDTYLTHNALVQQGSLPDTGLTTHNNYLNTVLSNQYAFNPNWLGSFVFDASELHLTQTRNSDLGFALAFPFTSTSQTISGFETVGDNQFMTPITLFPSLRNQQKYQFRYDLSHASGNHAINFGVDFIHEPVLGGAFPANAESFTQFVFNPADYLNPQVVPNGLAQFNNDLTCATAPDGTPLFSPNTTCSSTPAGDGGFRQNIQRFALYAEDSWRATQHLTLNYGLRWQTTFGLFNASGMDQTANPAFSLLPSLGYPEKIPHDYRKQFGPRLGVAYSPGSTGKTVVRAGFGMFYNDLAQNGWATALQSVNPNSVAPPSLVDPHYKTPYAIHVTAGTEHAISSQWTVSADYTHEQGDHGYRAYPYDTATVFRSDNRSSYNALMLRVQGNVTNRFSVVAHYTLAKAETWGCVLGELFDYVNGVCDPNNAFAPGDYGPSGEDVRHRFVLAGTLRLPGGIDLTALTQAESARPFTIVNADSSGRISVNGVPEGLDQVRGSPYFQVDLRVARPFHFGDRWELNPFAEFFNLFNRNNPGANYVTSITLLPVPGDQAQSGNITQICTNPDCTAIQPIKSINQLRVPAGGLGDFFGPGTTVGIPFAAQLGIRVTF